MSHQSDIQAAMNRMSEDFVPILEQPSLIFHKLQQAFLPGLTPIFLMLLLLWLKAVSESPGLCWRVSKEFRIQECTMMF